MNRHDRWLDDDDDDGRADRGAPRVGAGMTGAWSDHDLAALHAQSWEGDEVLADQLDATIGGAIPLLRPLPVDLEELSGLMEGDPAWGGGWVDLNTGECRPATTDSGDLW